MYTIRLTKQAEKDLQKILASSLKKQLYKILEVIEENPFAPPYEKLYGDLNGAYSRRINIQHRLVYKIDEKTKSIIILRMWTHYDK